eukprot:10070703-Prorocentrum_lima.AAC.1
MRCIQCPTFTNVWTVVSSQYKEVLGFFMVYMDDVIMFGSTTMVKKDHRCLSETLEVQGDWNHSTG